jgi:hypothetical protein
MHDIEPYFNWRHLYSSEEDSLSPFFGRQYSEFQFTQTVYNYYIHPQWDDFGSQTMYLKILFTDYEMSFAIIEFIGEWNDAIENDVMVLKREIIDPMIKLGINKYILIGENILNFHSSDECYYEEWYEDVVEEGGWVAMLNMPEQSKYDFVNTRINRYVELIDFLEWRTYTPNNLFSKVDNYFMKKLGN